MADVAGGMTWGDPRGGTAEIIRNSKGVDQSAFKSAPDPLDAKKVVQFVEGEIATVNGDGKADKVASTATTLAYLNLVDKNRTDIRGSKTTTLVVGSGYHAQTSCFFNDGVTYTAASYSNGVLLAAAKDSDGIGKLRPAAAGEQVVATCLSGVKQVRSEAERARGDGFRQVIEVEFAPRGKA